MYAVIETGGKQYRVQNGDRITIEKLNVEDGGKVVFDKVLVCGNDSDIKVGTPYLDAVTVEGEVVESGKGKKVVIFKYKAKKDYRKKQGHRQPYTLVEIKAIDGDTTIPEKEEAPKKEKPKKKAKKKTKKAKKTEEKVEEKAEETVEEKVEEAVEEKAEEPAEDAVEEKVEEKPEEAAEEKAEEAPEEAEEKAEEPEAEEVKEEAEEKAE